MSGFNIEEALRSLYKDGKAVRRESWEQGRFVRLPNFKYYDPIMQDGSIFQPNKYDLLYEDWCTVDGSDLCVTGIGKHGFYTAMRYIYATSNAAAVGIWNSNTFVYLPSGVEGVLYIRSIEEGVPKNDIYIPARDDYLLDDWHPRILK